MLMGKFITHIRPNPGFSLGLKELWQYRELFYFFTWRDIKVKYKQTSLGILWALLQPLGMMLIFTFLFSRTWKIDTGPVAYPVFVLAGLILWNLFNASVSNAGESMIRNGHIINKIYFPRLVIPCSSLLVALFDFMIGFVIFIVFCIVYRQPLTASILFAFPSAVLIVLLASFGAGSFLAALNVKYRDFRYTIPFLLQFLFFSSQVIYPLQIVEQKWARYLLALNPVNAAIELFRYPLFGQAPDMTVIAIGTTVALLLAMIGIFYFRKTEAYFADLN
jgi:lipopolysaccharide transport system permease protein